jgi:hypothetical protein
VGVETGIVVAEASGTGRSNAGPSATANSNLASAGAEVAFGSLFIALLATILVL